MRVSQAVSFNVYNFRQSASVKSYPDNKDIHLIRMNLRPPLRDDQSTIIRLICISHYSYHFIWSLGIRIRRIQLHIDLTEKRHHKSRTHVLADWAYKKTKFIAYVLRCSWKFG